MRNGQFFCHMSFRCHDTSRVHDLFRFTVSIFQTNLHLSTDLFMTTSQYQCLIPSLISRGDKDLRISSWLFRERERCHVRLSEGAFEMIRFHVHDARSFRTIHDRQTDWPCIATRHQKPSERSETRFDRFIEQGRRYHPNPDLTRKESSVSGLHHLYCLESRDQCNENDYHWSVNRQCVGGLGLTKACVPDWQKPSARQEDRHVEAPKSSDCIAKSSSGQQIDQTEPPAIARFSKSKARSWSKSLNTGQLFGYPEVPPSWRGVNTIRLVLNSLIVNTDRSMLKFRRFAQSFRTGIEGAEISCAV
jgi:hypothetical protein